MRLNNRQDVVELTSFWKGERFEDGRPRVEDKYLEMLANMTLEEIWMPLYIENYKFQFEGDLKMLHPEKKLIGRAVTCNFVPYRPDLYQSGRDEGEKKGWNGTFNQWVIDSLGERDVVVADMYDKIYNGTFLGGILLLLLRPEQNREEQSYGGACGILSK